MTKEQREDLIKAIELAEGQGQCHYTNIDQINNAKYLAQFDKVEVPVLKPVCVIGQYMVLRGISAEKMLRFEMKGIVDIIYSDNWLTRKEKELLVEDDVVGDVDLLKEIQAIWDVRNINRNTTDVVGTKKARMLEKVL